MSDPKKPVLIEPGFLLTNNTYKSGLSGHIGDIAEKMPITLFTFDIPIDFVNTSGSTKKLSFFDSENNKVDEDYLLNSSNNYIKKTNPNQIILNIPLEELQKTDKFNKVSNFYLEADSESFKSTSLSTLHIQSNLNKNDKNYLKIDKIFNIAEEKSSTYLTENLEVINTSFSPTINNIPIYHNAQEITITMTFNKKLKTTPYLKIKNTDMNVFYNTPSSATNIIGNIKTTGWTPKYEFKIPGTGRKIHDTPEGYREDINFEIVDGLSSNTKIKHIFDKPYTDQSANIFYISDDGTAPIKSESGNLSSDPTKLIYDLNFGEPVSSVQTIQGASLTKDNLDITLTGPIPEDGETQLSLNTNDITLVKNSDSVYKLTLPLNHKYFTSSNKIKIQKKDSHPIYDKKFNVFTTTREITLSDKKPTKIKNISNLAIDNKSVTIKFSEEVCKKIKYK